MISKEKVKYIHSLKLKKIRKSENAFVAECPKVVGDLLEIIPARIIVATKEWIEQNVNNDNITYEIIEVTDEELKKVSFLQHPQQVIAVFPEFKNDNLSSDIRSQLSLALDGVQDPGNLGTIIRIADWFGIQNIFCSKDTADLYNPKVIQATMGSIARVNVVYTDLLMFINTLPSDFPIYGTLLDGDNIYHKQLLDRGLIIMGNEGNGISPAIRARINHKLFIPSYPEGIETAESLNVAVATAITCNEFRRK